MKLRYAVLLGVTVLASLALAGSASATTLTSPTGTVASSFHAASEGHVAIDTPIGEVRCASTMEGAIVTQGAGKTTAGLITTLTFSGCTEGWHTTVTKGGAFEVHYTSGYNATLTLSGSVIDITAGGVTCEYGTNATDIGTMTGGNPGTIHVLGNIPVNTSTSSIFCGPAAAQITGSYFTGSALYVDA